MVYVLVFLAGLLFAAPASAQCVGALLSDGTNPCPDAATVRSNLGFTGTGAGTVTSVAAGAGMDFSTITGTGSVAASANTRTTGIVFIIDGGGAAITTGSKGYVEIPFACTITAARLQADQSGSIVVDIKKATYSGLPTTTSIAASAKPTLSTAQKNQDTTLTGWTTSITAGDWLEYVVDSATTVTRVTVSLTCLKS